MSRGREEQARVRHESNSELLECLQIGFALSVERDECDLEEFVSKTNDKQAA